MKITLVDIRDGAALLDGLALLASFFLALGICLILWFAGEGEEAEDDTYLARAEDNTCPM